MLVASYEALRFQRLDLFTVTLKQIGNYLLRTQVGGRHYHFDFRGRQLQSGGYRGGHHHRYPNLRRFAEAVGRI